jgi:DNA adenine methylase
MPHAATETAHEVQAQQGEEEKDKAVSPAPTRPILRYHGGKWKLAPWIISFFPAHRVYVEPYGGAASVLLRKERSYAEVYNDLDKEIVNLFRVVRDRGAELIQQLKLTPFARDEYLASFKRTEDPLEQARRTVIRSFMGFGSNALRRDIHSGFRSNSNRSGTTPGRDWVDYAGTGFRTYTGDSTGRMNRRTLPSGDWKELPSALSAIIDRLRGVVIENIDAIKLLDTHDSPKTIFYCDPPYPPETRSSTTGKRGYTHEITIEQHCELAAVLKRVKGMVILSGYPCDLYDKELYPDWHRYEREHLADGARKRTEVLWLNEAAFRNMPQRDLF